MHRIKPLFLTIDALLFCCGVLQFFGIQINGQTISQLVGRYINYEFSSCAAVMTFPNERVSDFVAIYLWAFLIGTVAAVLIRLSGFQGGPFSRLVTLIDKDEFTSQDMAFSTSSLCYAIGSMALVNLASRFTECWGQSGTIATLLLLIGLFLVVAAHMVLAHVLTEWLYTRKIGK